MAIREQQPHTYDNDVTAFRPELHAVPGGEDQAQASEAQWSDEDKLRANKLLTMHMRLGHNVNMILPDETVDDILHGYSWFHQIVGAGKPEYVAHRLTRFVPDPKLELIAPSLLKTPLRGRELIRDEFGISVVIDGDHVRANDVRAALEIEFQIIEHKEPPQTEPELRVSTDGSRSAKAEREVLWQAIASILGNGLKLTPKDLQEIMPHYGYKASSDPASARSFMQYLSTKRAIAQLGVKLTDDKSKNRIMWADESFTGPELPPVQ